LKSFVFLLAREIISDNDLDYLASKYHHRHPTFTIDIQERTCQLIIFACTYHYRHIEIDLRCECIYNIYSEKFQLNWSTDNMSYKHIIDRILLHINSSATNRSIDDQIETIIERITEYFTKWKTVDEELRCASISLSPSIEILQYEDSPRSRRRLYLERSLSWSQSLRKH